jgi:hypothetical protein
MTMCHARGAGIRTASALPASQRLAAGLRIDEGLDALRVGVLSALFASKEAILETHAMSASRSSHVCFDISKVSHSHGFNRE